MQKFNTNTIVSSYIKELLKDFNLPRVRVWRDEEPHIDDCVYLKNLEFVKYENGNLTKVGDYIYNNKYLNITHNLINSSLLYDSNTHEYLGEYLRFMRDYKHLDLMSMYNCVTSDFPKNMNLTFSATYVKAHTNYHWTNMDVTNGQFTSNDVDNPSDYYVLDTTEVDSNYLQVEMNASDTNYKIYMANVSAFHDYTIAIDCSEKIELFAGYYNKGLYQVTNTSTNRAEVFYQNTYESHTSNRHQHPFVYSKLNNSSLFTKERLDHNYNLYLFIKVPATCTSAIVVLEGNYLDNCKYISCDNSVFRTLLVPSKTTSDTSSSYVDLKSSYELGEYISRPQLLSMSSTTTYPFADRLVEYLVENVITELETIRDNVVRVQKTYVSNKFKETYGYSLDSIEHYGVWNEKLRQLTYRLAMDTNKLNSKFDIIGYVDKDMETYIGD